MAETPIRFAILGCAEIARKLSRAISLSPNARLHAIGSRSLDKAQRYAETNALPSSTKLYGNYDAILDDPDVDAVYLPLPTSLHLRWAVRAADKGKHVLLEKPVALSAAELDEILAACESSGVQFMDGTMWMHHPRTVKMREFLSDAQRFGQLKTIQTYFSFAGDPEFLKNDIRVKPDLDALGALGDAGWYCIRALLWAADYELPKFVKAQETLVKNEAGNILSCGASLHWEDGKVGTFQCSFLANLTMDITAVGTNGTLHVLDFIIPYQENEASFSTASESGLTDMDLEWSSLPSKHTVTTDLPQEVIMVKEFATLVSNIKKNGVAPEKKWPIISRKTQLVLDTVMASINNGFEPINVVY